MIFTASKITTDFFGKFLLKGRKVQNKTEDTGKKYIFTLINIKNIKL